MSRWEAPWGPAAWGGTWRGAHRSSRSRWAGTEPTRSGTGSGMGTRETACSGAVNSLNPFYWIGSSAKDAYVAASQGNYRAAGAAGATAVILGGAMLYGGGKGAAGAVG